VNAQIKGKAVFLCDLKRYRGSRVQILSFLSSAEDMLRNPAVLLSGKELLVPT